MANAMTGQAGSVSLASAGVPPETETLKDVLADARDTAREQLTAAWQIEVDRVQEQLAAGFRIHVDRVFDERFTELAARIEERFRSTIEARVDSAVAGARTKARRDLSNRLNQSIRRLRSFDNEADWSRSLVDATEGFCDQAALFIVNGPSLRLETTRGVASEAKIDNTPLESAPAFAGAVESRDTIVALRARSELSGPIADLLGEAPEKRFHLFPILSRDRVSAVLYADSTSLDNGFDASALELLATFASAVLDGQPATPKPGSNLVSIAGADGRQAASGKPGWSSLNRQEQEIHLRAQRFARVQVAEMRLYKSQAVKSGRLERDVYGALREDIDRTREAFRRDYLSASPTMVDYIHLELLRNLANDDVELLGPEYPGPMV